MKLLVYAFEPYAGNRHNISQQVLVELAWRPEIFKVVLPVIFDESPLLRAVDYFQPSRILGLGQYPRGDKIRIERLARNEQRSKSRPTEPINSNYPKTAAVSWQLGPQPGAELSSNAGRFVCNFSMFNLLTNPKTKNIPSAFLHIPKNLNLNWAIKFVEAEIEEILN